MTLIYHVFLSWSWFSVSSLETLCPLPRCQGVLLCFPRSFVTFALALTCIVEVDVTLCCEEGPVVLVTPRVSWAAQRPLRAAWLPDSTALAPFLSRMMLLSAPGARVLAGRAGRPQGLGVCISPWFVRRLCVCGAGRGRSRGWGQGADARRGRAGRQTAAGRPGMAEQDAAQRARNRRRAVMRVGGCCIPRESPTWP